MAAFDENFSEKNVDPAMYEKDPGHCKRSLRRNLDWCASLTHNACMLNFLNELLRSERILRKKFVLCDRLD